MIDGGGLDLGTAAPPQPARGHHEQGGRIRAAGDGQKQRRRFRERRQDHVDRFWRQRGRHDAPPPPKGVRRAPVFRRVLAGEEGGPQPRLIGKGPHPSALPPPSPARAGRELVVSNDLSAFPARRSSSPARRPWIALADLGERRAGLFGIAEHGERLTEPHHAVRRARRSAEVGGKLEVLFGRLAWARALDRGLAEKEDRVRREPMGGIGGQECLQLRLGVGDRPAL